MTCASIGRESPKPVSESKKRKLTNQTQVHDGASKPPESKISRKEIDSRSEKDETSKVSKTSSEKNSPEQALKPVRSPVTSRSVEANIVRPKSNGSNPERKTSIKTQSTPTIPTSTIGPGLGTPTTNLLNPSLLQSAELDRYLRASASLYSATTLQHPASALSQLYPSALGGSLPGLPGLLPQMPYMPFYTGYPQATLGLTAGMNALFPGLGATTAPTLHPAAAAPGLGSTSASLTSETEEKIPQRTCDWANCGKKFATPEQLAEHVKEHVTSMPTTPTTPPTPQSAKASVTAGLAATTTNPMALPRFSPYNISSYPRDLLSSRFVYS